jgi:uncharacterized membrane protein
MFWTIFLGIATGMRTMTAIAVVCWAAYLGYLPVEGTWAFWTAKLVSVIVFTVFALGEYVGDTLPSTPSRKKLPLVAGRLSFAVLVGIIVATSLGQPKAGGVLLGVMGALIGIYGGYRVRMWGARLVGRDLPVALTESALAVGFSVLAMVHIHSEIVTYASRAAILRSH